MLLGHRVQTISSYVQAPGLFIRRVSKPKRCSKGQSATRSQNDPGSGRTCCRHTMASLDPHRVSTFTNLPGALDTLTQTPDTQTSCCLNVCFVDMPALELLFHLRVTVLHVSACLDLAQRTMRACLFSTQIQRIIFIKNSFCFCEAKTSH